MSEFQYFEFQAIDRPLTQREMGELRALSTRARITPTSFVNTYEWGDFKGEPAVLMEKYFDAFLYFANWGTRILMLRVPRRLLDVETASLYCEGDGASLKLTKDHAVFSFWHDREPDDEDVMETGEGMMASIIPIREALMKGDLRALYLGWLLCVQQEQFKATALEPPVPPGMGSLSTGPLHAFVDFLRIDPYLIDVAAEASSPTEATGPGQDAAKQWIAELPRETKDEMLLRVLTDRESSMRAELLKRFRESKRSSRRVKPSEKSRRIVADLLSAAEDRAAIVRHEAAVREMRERQRKQAEEAKARAKYLKRLATRERQAWGKVESLIARKHPSAYDEAVSLLKDLGEIAHGRKGDFRKRVRQIREANARKLTLIARLDQANVGH